MSVVEQGSWDRQKTRAKFEERLLAECEQERPAGETHLDLMWLVVEWVISDVLAHLPTGDEFNVSGLTSTAIEHACRELHFPLGDFENQRKSMAIRGFACAILRVNLPMGTVADMLDRTPKRLWQAMKRLTEEQRERARAIGATVKPKWHSRKT